MPGRARFRPFLAFLYLALTALPARAWGPEGHAIVALLAQDRLSPAARRQASALLGGDNRLVLDADWADEIRDARPETAPWHYVNIPLDAPGYARARDCADQNCVVAQIERETAMLSDRRLPKEQRADALRFLIHFVADLHQPLHAADNGDRGGNDRVLYLRGKRTNLHRLWDTDMPAAWGGDPFAAARAIGQAMTPEQVRAGGAPADWANESLKAARQIYAPLRNAYLPKDYPQRWRGLAEDRLARAGVRLAALLNRILK